MVLILSVVHGLVELIKVPVPQQVVVDDIPLPASVVERVAVAFTREVEPLADASVHLTRFAIQGCGIPQGDQTRCPQSSGSLLHPTSA